MINLGEYGTKEEAVARAESLLSRGYTVTVTVFEGTYTVWATRYRTVFTGGWNR